jgi:cyclic pyranopterin phosphate synthase
MNEPRLSHLDARGHARMVDVGHKDISDRSATASAMVRMQPRTLRALKAGKTPKGDVLAVARVAGIQAAKRTSELIPMCHQVRLSSVNVDLDFRGRDQVRIEARVRAVDRTGVEMEALCAVSVAALTLYDMLKAIDREIVIERVALEEKLGGKSGLFRADRSDRAHARARPDAGSKMPKRAAPRASKTPKRAAPRTKGSANPK